MSHYQHLLVAVEADSEAHRLIAHAVQLAKVFEAELTLLHVVEPVPMALDGGMGALPVDFTGELIEQSKTTLTTQCVAFGLRPDQLRVELGSLRNTILQVATDIHADLIVVGHHKRRGLAALFSHTDADVASKAHCDVLAVALTDSVTS